jgi:ketosteroid isomerase-like protein
MSRSKFPPALVRAHQAYVDAINSNITDKVMKCYDKGAAVMQPDGPLVTGHRAIRQWVSDYFRTTKTHWKKVSKVMWIAGEWGFDQGVDTATERPRRGGPVSKYTVKGILIYKKQGNGEFKVWRDIWNYNSVPNLTRGES